MAKDFMGRMRKKAGAVVGDVNPHNRVMRITRSPGVGFTFGNGHGLPLGYGLLMYGKNKCGKSLIAYDTIGALHQDDPEGWVVKYDTEFREALQLTPERRAFYGIDPERYMCWSTNRPEEIFDHIETELAAMIDDGLPLRAIIIDSLSMIMGRRELKNESVLSETIGDQANTLKGGLSRIVSVIRRRNIALICTTHVRAELDPIEQKRGNSVKMQGAWAAKHFFEYFGYVERNDTVGGRKNLLGEDLINKTLRDMRTNSEGQLTSDGEATGHKIKFIMKESSAGPRGRCGEFLYDYKTGIAANPFEEVFLLGVARNIFKRENNTYSFGNREWNGKKAVLLDLQKDTDLQKAILQDLRRRDMAGEWAADEENEDSKAAPSLASIGIED